MSFAKLKEGINAFINKTHFDRLTMILRSTGFLTSALIRSRNAVNFAYILYLRGRSEGMPADDIERMVRRWYAMSILTRRYSGSPETAFDFNIRQIEAQGVSAYIDVVIENELPATYWTGMLPQVMDTSSSQSPYFIAYQAAQARMGDKGFLSTDITVRDLLLNRGDKHHVFPRKYLQRHGLNRGRYNQIANFVIAQSEINIAIGDKAPEDYFAQLREQVNGGERRYGGITDEMALRENLAENCLPASLLDEKQPDYKHLPGRAPPPDGTQDQAVVRGAVVIADLKPYPAYKDSGVEWLGDVPEHWEVRTLAQFGKLSKGCGGNKDDEVAEGVPCVRYGDLYTTHDHCIRKSRSFVSKGNAAEYTTIRFGDVLFAGSGETIDEIGKSAVNLMQTEACCGGDVIVFRPSRQVDARYLGLRHGLPSSGRSESDYGAGYHRHAHLRNSAQAADPASSSPPRTNRHSPLPRPRRPPYPALHTRQAEVDHADGGAEAGPHPPRCDARPRPQRPPQALRCGVAGGRAGALGSHPFWKTHHPDNGFPVQERRLHTI